MSQKRIIFQNWIVELGRDPDQTLDQTDPQEIISIDSETAENMTAEARRDLASRQADREKLQEHVRQALGELSENEQEFIRQFYFMGKSYREISEKSGRAVYRLEAVHRRALKKLRKSLTPFVEKRFNLVIEDEPDSKKTDCPICLSPARSEIDRLIAGRDRQATWKTVIKILREKYNLKIKSPQLLIGHEKYHRYRII